MSCDATRMALWVERSDGEKFEFGQGGWMVTSDGLENWANLSLDVSTSANVLRDGSSLVSKRADETDRSVTAEYRGKDADAARMAAIRFFNHRFTFKLHSTYRGHSRWCEGVQTGFKSEANNIHQRPSFTWTLLCLNPYWRSEDGNEREFGDSNPYLGWPYVSHVLETLPNGEKYPAGNPTSLLIYDGKNTITNTGDAPTYYRVSITAKAELVNPTVTKDGRYIQVLTTLTEGDVLIIDFEAQPPEVTINGKDAITLCSRDSTFTGMRMEPGASVFSFSVDNDENREQAKVQVLYHMAYEGL